MLFIDNKAAKKLWNYLGIGRHDYPPNRVEQGGLFAGFRLSETAAVVTLVIPADHYTAQTSGYVEWSGLEDIYMRRKIREYKSELAKINPEMAHKFEILGWFHSHPNQLPVFMSRTDRATQTEKYPDSFALVVNPHTMIWKAYWGASCKEIPVIMPAPATDSLQSVRQKHQKMRKTKYGLPRGGKKKRKGRR